VVTQPQIFLDCDGVLADFDRHAYEHFGGHPRLVEEEKGQAFFWESLEKRGDFYRNLPLMRDAMTLVEGVRHLNPIILTGCPRGDWSQPQKTAWAKEHFPDLRLILCRSAEKRNHAKPGDVLIDDWPQYRHLWVEMGGVFISHFDAETSLQTLWAHYPDLKL
jgi:5'(3')-deoxyribonucleotidase